MREDLTLDCAVENEREAEDYVKCPICGKTCLGLAFNKFLCVDCDHVEYYDANARKTFMGDEFIEIDEQELDTAFSAIK